MNSGTRPVGQRPEKNAPEILPTNPRVVTYRIRHQTEYEYSEPVAACQNQLRMQPVTGGNLLCDETEVTIDPDPNSWDEHYDYFGNLVTTFSIEAIHTALRVIVESRVTVTSPSISEIDKMQPWEGLLNLGQGLVDPEIDEHRYCSPRINPSEAFAAYANESFSPGRGIFEAALDLTCRINKDFAYDVTATTVDTTTEQAFKLRAGVCQDFAHVQIACLRSLGLAARYVSGYLRTTPPPGKERLVGADESHAWIELYGGEKLGWLGLDPTNACLVSTDHIPICIGRDYGDVSPMRGVVLGGGTNILKVSVDVEPQDE
ncbi:transglutaminase family protein [Stieleria sp. JC731]|uniref:transglutaminase family protein n=1 Tax=Pirellulaceae TaxID=2691357 RepID=UPI001E49EFA9|nr:transglutaminase family protein [Stieleria sp. JC731]MCC9599685.1 transglutaminase family protein [Stieleria sp. JC731]